MTRFSFVIPCLNEEKFVPKLLTSLVQQSDKDFEVVVVDGSSKDKTIQKVKSFEGKVPGLTVVVSELASLPLQRNIGAKNTNGDWLIFVDADTVLMPYFVERIRTFIENENPSFFTTWFRSDTEVAGDAMIVLLFNMTLEGSIVLNRPLSPGPLTLVKRTVYDSVGGYDKEHAFNEDIDFSLRIYKKGIPLKILRETLAVWSLRRLRKDGVLTYMQYHIRGALPVLFFNKTMKYMPGYIMGGQEYKRKKPPKASVIREYQKKLKKLMKELFE